MKYMLAASLLCSALVCAEIVIAQENPIDIVAAAVRVNGYECNNAKSVKPDPEHTTPDEKAWIIRCENASYQVKFVGDRGAKVEPIRKR